MEILFCIVAILILGIKCSNIVEYSDALYNIVDANASNSMEMIEKLRIQYYEYDFDTIPGRKHIGIIDTKVQSLMPDSFHVHKEQMILNPLFHRKDRASNASKLLTLKNYYVIDKSNVFMHNVVATKNLIASVNNVRKQMNESKSDIEKLKGDTKLLQEYLKQEASVQLIEKTKAAKSLERLKELEIKQDINKGEEERKTIQYRQQIEIEIEETREKFAIRQLKAEDVSRREQNTLLVQQQEEAQLRVELQRRETEVSLKERQLKADRENFLIETNASLERTRIEVEGKIKQQRMNEDIETRQMTHRHDAELKKVLQAIQMTFDNIGGGFTTLVTNTDQLMWFIGSCVALAAGVYIARESVRVIGRYIEQHLGKPSLVRETSRATGFIGFLKTVWSRSFGEDELNDVVLDNDLQVRILEVARATKNSQKHSAPFRHLLLYGAPGTGKTMVAKRLARCSGLDYAIMSGGDVGPLGSDAVTELHSIFRWAKSSPRGVLLFIDEAEAFLGSRSRGDMSESMRNALNALLYQTGEQSQKFMMVIATNRPEDLDTAVTDRIDETLHFVLPGGKERLNMLQMYYKRYIAEAHLPHNEFGRRKQKGWWSKLFSKSTEAIDAACIKPKHLAIAEQKTKGMSGREISKLMLYLQSVVYGQSERIVTVPLFMRVVDDKVKEHARKQSLKHI